MMAVNIDGVVFGLQALLPLLPSGSAVVVTRFARRHYPPMQLTPCTQ